MKIANIVATITVSSTFDIWQIHKLLPETEIPGKFPWLKMRLPPNNTYIAFYKSGKFLITTKDPKKIKKIAQQVLKILHSVGINVKIIRIEIHNIVVQASIPLNSSLDSIIVNLDPRKAEFEPEQFPALVYKDWGVSFLLFSTGKVIITGLKDFEEAEQMVEKLKEVVGSG